MNNLIFTNPVIGSIDLITDDYIRLTALTGVSAIAQINTQSTAGRDGTTIASMTVPYRQIIVEFRIRHGIDAEQAMHDLYRIFSVKSSGIMTFKGRLGSSKIDYIVKSIEIPPNAESLRGNAVLICPDPFFRAVNEEKAPIAGLNSFFSFPFTFPDHGFYIAKRMESLFADVYNDGEANTGMMIQMIATAQVVNPALINVATNEEARLNFTMAAGDIVRIYTETGEKKITLTRNGVTTNIFGNMHYPFTFLQLAQGNNTFKYDADEGATNMNISVTYSAKFGALYTNAPNAIDARGWNE